MQVLALSDAATPWHSFWIRFGQYATDLDLQVEISTDPARMADLGHNDVLLLYRYNRAWGDLEPSLTAAAGRGVRLMADVDDFLWQAPGWDALRLRAFSRALRHCRLISCSTEPLQEALSAMFRRARVVLIANSTPPTRTGSPPISRGPVQVCWTGAPWTRPQDLALLQPLVHWARQRDQPVRWRHIGHREGQLSFAEAVGVDPALVEVHPLLPHQHYLQTLGGDIGLAPLAPSSFNSFKSELKLLEYSGLAMPWIASDATPYRDLCTRWHWQGRLCRQPDDWIMHLEQLLDPATRQQEGQALQALAHGRQNHAQTVARWRSVLISG